MGAFEDRKKGFEAKFVRETELEFRVAARRNRLAGFWAAEKMGLSEAEAEAYAKQVIQADFEEAGDDDVIRKISGDLIRCGIEISDITLRQMLDEKQREAREQIERELHDGK